MSNADHTGVERRKAKRRPILESFSLFVVVPGKGDYRLPLHDLSELGIGFDLDMEGEDPAAFPIKPSEHIDVLLYLNQTLSIPLTVKVARIVDEGGYRKIGAEFLEKNGKSHQALLSFVKVIDELAEIGRVS